MIFKKIQNNQSSNWLLRPNSRITNAGFSSDSLFTRYILFLPGFCYVKKKPREVAFWTLLEGIPQTFWVFWSNENQKEIEIIKSINYLIWPHLNQNQKKYVRSFPRHCFLLGKTNDFVFSLTSWELVKISNAARVGGNFDDFHSLQQKSNALFKRDETSSLLNMICRQIWYQRKSDYMDRA